MVIQYVNMLVARTVQYPGRLHEKRLGSSHSCVVREWDSATALAGGTITLVARCTTEMRHTLCFPLASRDGGRYHCVVFGNSLHYTVDMRVSEVCGRGWRTDTKDQPRAESYSYLTLTPCKQRPHALTGVRHPKRRVTHP